jgi:hypothetical protein
MSNTSPTSTTVLEAEAAVPVEEPVDLAQQGHAAREHLQATQRRLDALALRQHVREQRLVALAEQEHATQAEAQRPKRPAQNRW